MTGPSTPNTTPKSEGVQNQVRGKFEDADEEARQDHELSHIVEGEPEEGVQVPGSDPAVG
jgi:hypothetical protein